MNLLAFGSGRVIEFQAALDPVKAGLHLGKPAKTVHLSLNQSGDVRIAQAHLSRKVRMSRGKLVKSRVHVGAQIAKMMQDQVLRDFVGHELIIGGLPLYFQLDSKRNR